jgi:hypothetical protein
VENKRPLSEQARTRAKWGVGVRHALFPGPTFGAIPGHGCRLPDAILHGKRSVRPRSRAVQRLAATGLSSEASQLAWAGGCATGLRTRLRHACDLAVRVLTACAGSATVFGGALAQCHGSDLLPLRLPFVHRPAVRFMESPAVGRCGLPSRLTSPRRKLPLSAFRRLWCRRRFYSPPKVHAPY